jgi:hypothetical protein
MKFLAILGIGSGVGMLGGLLILWIDRWHETRKKLKDSEPSVIADGRR